MKFTAIVVPFFALMSSVALADKPSAIPDGASAIDKLPSAASASRKSPASSQQQASAFDETSQSKRRSFSGATVNAPQSGKTIDKRPAPKIEARSLRGRSHLLA